MATPTLQSYNTTSESIIAGYFQSGEDAHRAINALLDEGFLPTQIGAAFHSSSSVDEVSKPEEVLGGNTLRESLGTTVHASLDSDTSVGGASSDDFAVQPIGVAPGSGSPILGAGKPGFIPGSDLHNTGLPTELTSSLQHDQPDTHPAPAAQYAIPETLPTPAPQHHTSSTGWAAKLKDLFSSKSEKSEKSDKTDTATPSPVTAESQNFGTGEGHLNLTPPAGYAYSQPEFERSVSGFGVEPTHSRHLSQRLAGGGAVVTVSATGRATDVERIFESHHGQVRFASEIFSDAPALSDESRVEFFGHLEHIYPNYNR